MMANKQNCFTGRMLKRAANYRLNYNIYNVQPNVSENEVVINFNDTVCRIDDDKSGKKKNNDNLNLPNEKIYLQSNIINTIKMKTTEEEKCNGNESVITSLTAAIDDLDMRITDLGIRNQDMTTAASAVNTHRNTAIDTHHCIYPILSDVKFDKYTSTPRNSNKCKKVDVEYEKKLTRNDSSCSDENNKVPNKPPRRQCVHTPNLESTRRTPSMSLSPTSPVYSGNDHQTTKCCIKNTNSPCIESTISSIPAITNSPLIQNDNKNDIVDKTDDNNPNIESEAMASCCNTREVPVEVEKFLENALSDEACITTTYSECKNDKTSLAKTKSTNNQAQNNEPFYKKISKILHRRENVTTNETNNKTGTRKTNICRTLSERIKDKLRVKKNLSRSELSSSGKNLSTSVLELTQYPLVLKDQFNENTEEIQRIVEQISVQQSILIQASKAVELCHSKKEFTSSIEEVESQRLLLLAELKKRILVEKLTYLCRIPNISNDNNRIYENQRQHNYLTNVNQSTIISIKNIKLILKKCFTKAPEPGDIHDWYVVVITEGINMWTSNAVSCPINSYHLEFPGFECIMKNLTPNFRIVVDIYVLKLTTGVTFCDSVKYHIDMNTDEDISTTCPSPKDLLKKIVVTDNSSSKSRCSVILPTSFTHCGCFELYVHDLQLSSPWPLSSVPKDSLLHGTIDLELNYNLHLSVEYQGFLNEGTESLSDGFIIWNRKWCVLKEHSILFWNYPHDHENNVTPVKVIDLKFCISDQICVANRSFCAKPRTLLIKTIRPKISTDADSLLLECYQSNTIVKHLISFDSTRELVDWMSKLNYILSILRQWNITTTIQFTNNAPSASEIFMVSEL